MEFLSFAEDEHSSRRSSTRSPGLEVEVVLTVRDQFRAIPAQWQTFTRNFGTDDWETYLRRIDASGWRGRRSQARRRPSAGPRTSSAILDRWSG